MKVQCSCGGAYVGLSKRLYIWWQENHTCPPRSENDTIPEEAEDDDSRNDVDMQPAHLERSWQDGAFYDGDYRYLPGIQARQSIGFQVESRS